MKVMARRGTRALRQRFAPNRLMAWQQTDQRRLWRRCRALISLMALLVLFPGCRGPRQSLHVLVVPNQTFFVTSTTTNTPAAIGCVAVRSPSA
jgi:hypothetical protein